jgi:hypothetical protein
MKLNNAGRNMTFRNAGDHDVTEVNIASGEYDVQRGSVNERISYSISYVDDPNINQQMAEAIAEAVKNKLSEFKA